MRNLGTRFNESNILNVSGGNAKELEVLISVLCKALETQVHSLTPSEGRVIDGLRNWYSEIDPNRPYRNSHPAYAYCNLNTGINLLFLIYVPFEGCRGGIWPIMDEKLLSLSAETYD